MVRSKSKMSAVFDALQLGVVVAFAVYYSYCEGLDAGKRLKTSTDSVGSDLPADKVEDDAAPPPKSTSLDGE